MSFFDELEPPEAPEEPVEREQPPWFGPPTRHLAALVADRRVLARGQDLVVVLSHLDVFPTGCSIRVRVSMVRPEGSSETDWQARIHGELHPRPGQEGRGQLRFGVDLGEEGRAVTGRWPRPPHTQPPDGPVLVPQGSGGSGGRGEYAVTWNLWLWPLPPPRAFDLVLQWPDQDIAETRVALDGAAIVAAAEESLRLFD